MAERSIGNLTATKRKTGKFVSQGQTAGPYGQNPSVDPKGVADKPARDLEP